MDCGKDMVGMEGQVLNEIKEIFFWWLLLDSIALILVKPWRDYRIGFLKKLNGNH
jgi:hypothetical protein